MLTDYWGRFRDGKLASKRFILLWLLLVLAFVAFGFAVGASLGIAENMVGGSTAEAQEKLRQSFSLPAIVLLVVLVLLFVIAKLNIIAKRARDAGLPGWITALAIGALTGTASQNVDALSTGGVSMLVVIILALIPTNSFGGSR